MPAWLTNEENYRPKKDKDAFVDKSILSLLHVLSRIRSRNAPSRAAASVMIRLPFMLLIIVLVSVSGQMAFIAVAVVATLLRLSLLKASTLASVLKTSLIAVAFTALILLPAVFAGNPYSILIITPKVFVSITAVGILSHTAEWDEITGALRALFVPDIMIFVLDITIRYVYMLGEFSLHMLWALKLRSVGKNTGKYASLSGVAGTMFLKSRDMSEQMHTAMQCRGFTGEYKRPRKFAFTFTDILYIMVAVAAVIFFIYFGR